MCRQKNTTPPQPRKLARRRFKFQFTFFRVVTTTPRTRRAILDRYPSLRPTCHPHSALSARENTFHRAHNVSLLCHFLCVRLPFAKTSRGVWDVCSQYIPAVYDFANNRRWLETGDSNHTALSGKTTALKPLTIHAHIYMPCALIASYGFRICVCALTQRNDDDTLIEDTFCVNCFWRATRMLFIEKKKPPERGCRLVHRGINMMNDFSRFDGAQLNWPHVHFVPHNVVFMKIDGNYIGILLFKNISFIWIIILVDFYVYKNTKKTQNYNHQLYKRVNRFTIKRKCLVKTASQITSKFGSLETPLDDCT